MNNRTLQVSMREFMENLRTKTFWVGIFAVPVILILAIVIMRLIAGAKETKVYAVLDLSASGLAEEIEEVARQGDVEAALKGALDGAPRTAAELERALAKAEADLPAGDPLRGLITALREVPAQDLVDYVAAVAEGRPIPPPGSLTRAVVPWLLRQDPEKLRSRLRELEVAQKYRRMPMDELGDLGETAEARRQALSERLNRGELFAYFVIPEDPVGHPGAPGADGDASNGFRYVSNNLTDHGLRQWYARAATEVVQRKRIARAEIAPETARWIQHPVTFRGKQVDEQGQERDVTKAEQANKFAPMGFVYLLWIAVMIATQMLLTNTVEEKSNRIIEVLLSSVSPLQLMAGKIWGIAATGLTIIGSWVVFASAAIAVAPLFLPEFKIPLAGVIGDPLYLASFVGYFLGGYLMYAAVLVAIGSVCNSLKEAQNLIQPVIIVLIIPLIAMVPVVQEPNGTVARVLTYIPMFTPFLMMNRAGGPPPAWEYALSAVVIVASVLLAFWAAGKIFRIGVLMTGKPPRLKEILAWLKAPVGAVHVRREG